MCGGAGSNRATFQNQDSKLRSNTVIQDISTKADENIRRSCTCRSCRCEFTVASPRPMQGRGLDNRPAGRGLRNSPSALPRKRCSTRCCILKLKRTTQTSGTAGTYSSFRGSGLDTTQAFLMKRPKLRSNTVIQDISIKADENVCRSCTCRSELE